MADKAIRFKPKVEYKELGNGLVMLHFEDAAQPSFVEKKGKPYVLYGEKNDYPNYLLYLYNNSAKHSAIINGKVDYVCGKGWTFDKDIVDPTQAGKIDSFIKRANAKGESLNEVTEKIELDLEIFNGAYLQIVWNRLGSIASIYHVDYTTVRSNKDNSCFYVSDEWVKYNPDGSYKPNNNPAYKEFKAFNTNVKKGSQILYVKKYHPGIDIYTLPNYRGSITWIEVDIEIGNYHLNNVKGGFFANKLINFNNGVPSEEGQKVIEKKFAEKFGGVRGRKYMLAFNNDSSKAATVVDLNISDSDKIFDQLNKTAQQEIFTGHRITSPMLFGIKTEGQLGGRSEMREAYEAFQNIYVNGRQQWIEKTVNMLAGYADINIPICIQRSEPIGFEFSENVISQNLTREEIREMISDRLSIKLQKEVPAAPVITSPGQQFSQEEDDNDIAVFAEFGQPRNEHQIVKVKRVLFTSDEDERTHFANVVADLTTIQENVLDLLNKDPLITQEVLAKTLDVDIQAVNAVIKSLSDLDLIKINEKTVRNETVIERKPIKEAKKLLKDTIPITRSIEVKYSYEGPKDSKNRPFCAKLLELDRLYSRAEIEQISTRLGYSVWARRGGWYTIPGTNRHRPYCRHSWTSNIVVKNKAR
jgi:DNA-binding MarR family transcriptional regulator